MMNIVFPIPLIHAGTAAGALPAGFSETTIGDRAMKPSTVFTDWEWDGDVNDPYCPRIPPKWIKVTEAGKP